MNNDSHKGQFSGKLGIEDALIRLNAKMVYARIEPVELVSCGVGLRRKNGHRRHR